MIGSKSVLLGLLANGRINDGICTLI